MLNLLKKSINIESRISIHLEKTYITNHEYVELFPNGVYDRTKHIIWLDNKNDIIQAKIQNSFPKFVLIIIDWKYEKIVFFNENSF